MIWNSEYECMDREELAALQLRRLQSTVLVVYDGCPTTASSSMRRASRRATSERWPTCACFPSRTRRRYATPTLRDVRCTLDEVVRLHSSSGTTGKPIVVGYTRGDINTWTECTARVAAAAGVHRGDLVDMSFLYGMFTGGWGMHYGIERNRRDHHPRW